MNKPNVPTFTPLSDAMGAIRKMDQHEPGPWWVWGDGTEPVLTDIDYDTMKKYVDEGQTAGKHDLYGEHSGTGEYYEGGKSDL